MSQPIETWLRETELAMQDSLRKQMNDSIQVAISTLHLTLSPEIQDILSNTDYSEVEKKDKPDEAEADDAD